MPLREERKSNPIRVDLQAVIRGEVKRVFKTKLVIILLRAVWIHVLLWSGFNETYKKCKIIKKYITYILLIARYGYLKM